MSRPRITRGKKDLDAPPFSDGRIRSTGGGRKKVTEKDPTLINELDALIEPTVRCDPMSGLRWTCKSTRPLANEFCMKGHRAGSTTVGHELRAQKDRLRGNRQTQEGSSHPDRNAQFLPVHETAFTRPRGCFRNTVPP